MANSFRIWILTKSVTLKGPNRVLLIKTVTHPTLPAAIQKNCTSWRHTGPPEPVLIIDSGRVVHVLWGTICCFEYYVRNSALNLRDNPI